MDARFEQMQSLRLAYQKAGFEVVPLDPDDYRRCQIRIDLRGDSVVRVESASRWVMDMLKGMEAGDGD